MTMLIFSPITSFIHQPIFNDFKHNFKKVGSFFLIIKKSVVVNFTMSFKAAPNIGFSPTQGFFPTVTDNCRLIFNDFRHNFKTLCLFSHRNSHPLLIMARLFFSTATFSPTAPNIGFSPTQGFFPDRDGHLPTHFNYFKHNFKNLKDYFNYFIHNLDLKIPIFNYFKQNFMNFILF